MPYLYEYYEYIFKESHVYFIRKSFLHYAYRAILTPLCLFPILFFLLIIIYSCKLRESAVSGIQKALQNNFLTKTSSSAEYREDCCADISKLDS